MDYLNKKTSHNKNTQLEMEGLKKELATINQALQLLQDENRLLRDKLWKKEQALIKIASYWAGTSNTEEKRLSRIAYEALD